MSLPRVSSLETFAVVPTDERSRRSSDASSRPRKLSFSPLPKSWAPPVHDQVQAIGAFEVPKWRRILQVAVTVVYCLFSAGIVFGYAAIKPVLKQEGAYRDECSAAGGGGSGSVDEDTCVEIRLNLMFTVAAVATNVAALPVGAILDRFGPRVSGVLGCIFLTIGAVFMALEKELPFDGLLSGYFFLALGGPFSYISSFQLSNAFPRNSGLILALLTGAFDASSALFLVCRLVYEKTGGGIGHEKFFLGYLVVPAVIVVLQFTLLPCQSYKTVGELMEGFEQPFVQETQPFDQVDEHTALLQEEDRQQREAVRDSAVSELNDMLASTKAHRQAHREEVKNEMSGVWGVMHNRTSWEQIRSPWFILICLFTVIQMLRINYLVATIRPQYEYLLHRSDRAAALNNFFDLALPLGGILSIPFIGLILDHTSTLTVLATLVGTTTLIGLLGLVPDSAAAAYGNVCLFVLYRPFYYTAVSDYAAKVFGFATFGTVYGAVICLAGVFNFVQSGLDYLFHETFRGDPTPVNVGLVGLGFAAGVALVGFVAVAGRSARRGKTPERQAEIAFVVPRWRE